MIAGWAAEGVGTEQVARVPGRVPGLYIIQTDARGERSFLYWRDSAPARALFDSPETSDIVDILPSYDLLYFSGITLSLYGDTGRARFFDVLHRAGQQGRRIAFDTNFRPRGWPDRALAQTAYRAAFDRADIILASTEDLELLFGAGGLQELLSHRSSTELVLKLATPACRVISADHDEEVHSEPVADVVDTTAAGDSFAAAYIAARLSGAVPREAAYTGHRLAGAVVRHPGAIIPSAAMPSGIIGTTRPQQGDARMTSATAAAASRTDRLKELLGLAPVIPVITIERVEDAVPLARALVSGGLRLLEITLRTPAGRDAAAAIVAEVPDAVVGIGTVLTPQDLARSRDLGARFALSPGATPGLLDAAAESDLPFMPGVATASELMLALAHGFDTVKFFPAVPAGGIAALKALAGPFPQARFCPTGGVSEENAAEWLALSNVVVVGGSWLTPAGEMRAGAWDRITERARRAAALRR